MSSLMTSDTRRMRIVVVAALAVLTACSGSAPTGPPVRPSGSPKLDLVAIGRHATQFEEQVPVRPGGSQEENIAATYLLGHLQVAGYLVRLDAVPVADLVRSTNVVAPPPTGADPEVVVAVAYDSPPQGGGDGRAVGLWLELARALSVSEPEHRVGFVALGAEHLESERAPLGSRRLARFLLDEEQDPVVVTIASSEGPAQASGPAADRVLPGAGGTLAPAGPDPLSDAGFDHVFVSGNPEEIGPELLGYLTDQAR